MFHTNDYWEQDHIVHAESHLEWHCKYDTLWPLIKQAVNKPRASALLIGPGLSTFPEQLYDSGVKDVVCVDRSEKAISVLKERSCPGRSGLQLEQQDWGQGIVLQHPPFDAVIDKGTLDCILCDPDSYDQAVQAVSSIYALMKTPATFIMVSHSPPQDRWDLLSTVYWHEKKVKVVKAPMVHVLETIPYTEQLEDWQEGSTEGFAPGTCFVYILTK